MESIENFYSEFNFAQTVEEKSQLLESFISNNEISDDDLKELQMQINDVIENSKIEEDITISMEIEDGKYSLYSCVKDFNCYKSGLNYYIKMDDPREFYKNTGIGETNTIIQNMIETIKPIYWIITDDGIGTLKRKNIFPNNFDFSEYFTKFA
jgi:hypothetical protein